MFLSCILPALRRHLLILVLLLANQAHADQITATFLGITIHGMPVNTQAAANMPRKLGMTNGRIVWHPEINVIYRKDRFMYNLTVVSDCQANPAGFIGMGPNWDFGWIQLSLPVGVYVRKNPGDEYELPPWIRHGNVDTIPIMWIALQKDIPIAEDWDFSSNLATNYFLTHLSFGFSHRF